MHNIFLRDKQEFKLFDFLLWLVLAIVFPAVTGYFSWENIVNIFIYLSAVYYAGELLLHKVDAIRQIPFLFKSGIYIIFGGIVAGVIFLYIHSGIIIYGLAFIFILDLFISKRIEVSFSFANFLCLLPFLVILFQTYELAYATTERYNHADGDYYFYTAIVESIKVNHSVNNALYHQGIPIDYMVAPFLAPAQLADFSGITAQFALWGVYSKIIPIACFGTLSYIIVKLYTILCKHTLTKNSFKRRQLLVAFMLLFLGPLHFINLAKFDFKNTLFLGEGYVLPTGSPGFALSMFFAGLVLLIVFSKQKYSLQDQLVMVVFLCIITGAKIALFFPLAVLLGTLSILWLFKKQANLFFTLLLALPFCIIIYKLTIAGADSIAAVGFTKNGYYTGYFGDLAGKYGIKGGIGKKVVLMLFISAFMWVSIKVIILVISGFGVLKSNYKAFTLIIAATASFIISFIPGFFINIYGRSVNGAFLYDGRFDTAQFVRASIFLLTVIAIVFSLYLISDHRNSFIRKGSLVLICLWMLTISRSFFANDYKKPPHSDQSWYLEVKHDFVKRKPILMAMMGNDYYSGQTLTTGDVYPWYCTGIKEDGEGFVLTKSAYERNIVLRSIFNTGLDIKKRKSIADSIRQLGVDCIVASPGNIHTINQAVEDSIISAIQGTKWFYRFN